MSWLAASLAATSLFLGLRSLAARRIPVFELLGVASVGGGSRSGSWSGGITLERLGRSRLAARMAPGEQLWRRCELAGLRWSADRVAGLRMLLAGIGVAATGPLALALPGALLVSPLFVALLLRLPDLVLARTARRRQDRIDGQVADLVELLLVTMQAGLSQPVALRRSARVLSDPLGLELRSAIAEVDLGLPWRSALDRLGSRTEAPALRRLIATVGRSERLGASVGMALRGVAGELRADRRARTEEAARRAPVKMLFPLVFLILPAFLLLTVGPVLLATIRSLK